MNKSHLLGAVCACFFALITTMSAKAALVSQLGGQAVFDTDLNITWLSNANLADTTDFGVGGIAANGNMTWATANTWISAMNTANYLGFSDWRMPTTVDPDTTCTDDTAGSTPSGDALGFNCTGSEMGHLFYNELGGVAGSDILTSSDPDLGKFSNISGSYWSSTIHVPGRPFAFGFTPPSGQFGFQGDTGVTDPSVFVWAVRGGTSAVPVPAAVWLFGSGLLGLIGIARRKKPA